MRSIYDEQLSTLHDSLSTMSALCEAAIAKAAKALQNNDLALADEVYGVTEKIDRLERAVPEAFIAAAAGCDRSACGFCGA